MKYQSLHCHTKTSDGELGYKEVLDACAENNISVVAFTDHDSLPDKKAMKILEENRDHPTKWIVGIEISSGYPKEIGGPVSNFHMVGLFVDPFDKNLVEHCSKAKEARVERMQRMVKNLQSFGFDITEEECLKEAGGPRPPSRASGEAGGSTVGRPHIVAALKRKKKNLKIIRQLKEEMAQKAEKDPELKKKYKKMVELGSKQYPYTLFLGPEAFLPGIFVNYLYWKDMDESVKLIRDAGGVAILAHWSFSKHKVGERMIEKFFKQGRLDGAEVVFSSPRIDEKDKKIKRDMETMRNLTEKYGVLQAGGADLHYKQDFKNFVQNQRLAEKTKGLAQKILKQRDLNLDWSSFK